MIIKYKDSTRTDDFSHGRRVCAVTAPSCVYNSVLCRRRT
jgi:hypothetical protein